MIPSLLGYFIPAERIDGAWKLKELNKKELLTYIIRSGIPFFIFWVLEVYFLLHNLLLFVVCLGICLPFALIIGILVREYHSQRGVDC